MKTLLGIILIIVAVALFVSFSKKDNSFMSFSKKDKAVEVEVIEEKKEEINAETVIESLVDGEFETLSTSTLTWTGKAIGKSHSGTLTIQDGDIIISDGDITGSLVFNMETIASPDGEGLVGHLKSEDFFETETYPTAQFNITNYTNENLEGDLIIKGITNTVGLPVSVKSIDGGIMLAGDIVFDRTDWNIQYGSGSFFDDLGDKAIDDDISLEFNVTALLKNAAE
jgi:polyisoprenoid-binding protein YceI